MGEILFRTKLSEQMFTGLAPWLNRIPGRLMHTTILGCGIFGSVSGSSAATCATIAKVALPELEKRGYDRNIALGSLAAAGGLGILIPPSITMVVYAVAADASVIRLFLAGFLPGFLLMGLFSGYIIWWSLRNPDKVPPPDAPTTFMEKIRLSGNLIPCALLIVFIVWVLVAGIATATECAAYGVLGSLANLIALRLAKLPKDRSATNPDAPSVYKESKAKESFTRQQYARLIAVLTSTADDAPRTATPSAYFIAMLNTGARPGEIDGLRWGEVDLEGRSITFDFAMKRADGGKPIRIGATKSGNRRDLEMTELLASALRRHRVLQAERRLAAGPLWTSDPRWADLVFTSEVGTPIDPSHARRDFKKMCTAANVSQLSLYEMRHTVASLMVDADIPLREVADLLGHKDLEMVVKRYRHRTEGVVKSHVAVL
eukprot:gene17888-36551_t